MHDSFNIVVWVLVDFGTGKPQIFKRILSLVQETPQILLMVSHEEAFISRETEARGHSAV